MQVGKRTESKLLGRWYVELLMEGKAGMLNRKDAIALAAEELKVPPENVGLIRLVEETGTTGVLGKFYVYPSPDARKKLHPRYLVERTLTKEEREKLRQERKKAAAPAPAPEAKK